MTRTIYLAGGCFWGTEHAMQMLTGVTDTTVGYANGFAPNPSYEQVKHSDTGHKETVEVVYDPEITSTGTLMKAFFLIIDPTRDDGQGEDIGDQYRTGVYYPKGDSVLKAELEAIFSEERGRHSPFHTELGQLEVFYRAEDYHQDYLLKNPSGYCHVTKAMLDRIRGLD